MRGTVAVALALLLGATGCAQGDLPAVAATCDDLDALTLVAQAVPEARSVPCFPEMPFGYRTTTFDVESGRARIALSHAVTGLDAAVMTVAATCDDDPTRRAPAAGELQRVVGDGDGDTTEVWVQGLGQAYLVVELHGDHPHAARAVADLEGAWRLLPRANLAASLATQSGGLLRLHGS